MNSSSKDLCAILQASAIGSIGAGKGWSISANISPTNPDTSITLNEYDSEAPDTDELDLYRVRVQVMVRARSFDVAYSKQVEIREALKIVSAMEVGGTNYLSITPISDIINTGQDDNNRFLLSQNFQVLRT